MIEDVQHIHHQLVLVYDHVFSFSSHHTQQVSAHQAHSAAIHAPQASERCMAHCMLMLGILKQISYDACDS